MCFLSTKILYWFTNNRKIYELRSSFVDILVADSFYLDEFLHYSSELVLFIMFLCFMINDISCSLRA